MTKRYTVTLEIETDAPVEVLRGKDRWFATVTSAEQHLLYTHYRVLAAEVVEQEYRPTLPVYTNTETW